MKNESISEMKYRLKYFYFIDIDCLLEKCIGKTSLEDIMENIMSECVEYNNFLNPTLTPISKSFFGEIRENNTIQELSGFDNLILENHSYIKIPGLCSPFINQVYTESSFKRLNKRIDKIKTEKKINRTDFNKIINGMNFIRKNPEYMDNEIDLLYSAGVKEYYYPLSLLIRANTEIRFMHEHDSPYEDLRGKMFEDIILATGEMTNVFSRQLFLAYGLYCYINTPTFYNDFLEHYNPKKSAVSILEHNDEKDITNKIKGQM